MNKRGLIVTLFSLLLISQSAEAGLWQYFCSWLNPYEYRCLKPHADNEDDLTDELLLENQQDATSYSLPAENDSPSEEQKKAALEFLQHLTPELQQQLQQEGVEPSQIASLMINNMSVTGALNQLMYDCAVTARKEECEHHTTLRAILLSNSAIFGSINRIAGLTGMIQIFSSYGYPPEAAMGLAATITLISLASSNMRAVSGTSQLRFQGIHSRRDLALLMVAAPPAILDVLMAIFGFKAFFALLGIDSYLPGIPISLPLGPALLSIFISKADHLSYRLRGHSFPDERKMEESVHMLATCLRMATQRGLTMGPENRQARLRCFSDALGLNRSVWPQSARDFLLRTAEATAVYAPSSRLKNQCVDLLDSDLSDEDFYLTQLHDRAINNRRGNAYKACNLALLGGMMVPAFCYGAVDSNAAFELIQTLSFGELAGCMTSSEAATYWVAEAGFALFMSGKFLAAGQDGAESIIRIVSWLKELAVEKNSNASKTDITLNILSGLAAGAYAYNVYSTFSTDPAECLVDAGANAPVAGLAAVGAYCFTSGSGPKLKVIPHAIKRLVQNIRRSFQMQFGASAEAEAMKYIDELRRELAALPSPDEYSSWSNDLQISQAAQSIIHEWLRQLSGYEEIRLADYEERHLMDEELSTADEDGFLRVEMADISRRLHAEANDIEESTTDSTVEYNRGTVSYLVESSYSQSLTDLNINSLMSLHNLISSNRYQAINIPCPNNLCMFQHVLHMLNSTDMTSEELVAQLIERLKKLMQRRDRGDTLNQEEKHFVNHIGLQALLTDLTGNALQNIETLQLIALHFNQDFIAIYHQDEQLVIEHISAQTPGKSEVIDQSELQNIAGVMVAHNSINHWFGISQTATNAIPATTPPATPPLLHGGNNTEAHTPAMEINLNPTTLNRLIHLMGQMQ